MPRATTPIALHKVRGTYRATRHKGKVEDSSETLTVAPEWFSEVERAEWDRLVAIDHIRANSLAVVEHGCILYARFVADAKGEKKMSSADRAMFHSVYIQLGLTPASAAKIPAMPEKVKDKWAALG